MSNDSRVGRHRAATRYSPVLELTTIARSAGQTGVKASAFLAASGGLVATFALPASAAAHQPTQTAHVAAPARAAVALTPAVVAPAAEAPVATPGVGVSGVTAVAKPKPKPRAAVRTAIAQRSASGTASRSASRVFYTGPQSSSAIVNIARQYLGIPYKYGGDDPSGFDCSGFTSYVFRKAGISIPRTASAQQDAARPVSDPQPGDLVFFGSPAWHVGIYTGHGMMIDSPREGKSTSERPIFDGVSGYGRF
ncbi:C40 family peptidase [Oryzobacter telluris]|uniref:C40 family peptidase n=1 Tax=Oryzobacter telluris TaxID=3149179 RepID=UPI00370D850E